MVAVRSPYPHSKVSYNAAGAPLARTACTRVAFARRVMAFIGQSSCLVINPIMVDFATLFKCTLVDRVSDSMMTPT